MMLTVLLPACLSSLLQLGTTAVGIQTSEGVVLAAEKRISSKLLVPSSVKKLVQLDGRQTSTRQREAAHAMRAQSPLCLTFVVFPCWLLLLSSRGQTSVRP